MSIFSTMRNADQPCPALLASWCLYNSKVYMYLYMYTSAGQQSCSSNTHLYCPLSNFHRDVVVHVRPHHLSSRLFLPPHHPRCHDQGPFPEPRRIWRPGSLFCVPHPFSVPSSDCGAKDLSSRRSCAAIWISAPLRHRFSNRSHPRS